MPSPLSTASSDKFLTDLTTSKRSHRRAKTALIGIHQDIFAPEESKDKDVETFAIDVSMKCNTYTIKRNRIESKLCDMIEQLNNQNKKREALFKKYNKTLGSMDRDELANITRSMPVIDEAIQGLQEHHILESDSAEAEDEHARKRREKKARKKKRRKKKRRRKKGKDVNYRACGYDLDSNCRIF